MPAYCCVRSCKNNFTYNSDLRFYEFPKVWNRSPKLKQLSELRIKKWCAAINRKSLNTKTGRVCSTHFYSGKCARLTDSSSPDWVPSLNLNRTKRTKSSEENASSITNKTLFSSDDESLDEEFLEEYLDETNEDYENFEDFKLDEEQSKKPEDAINCCVPNCKNFRSKRKSRVKFFRFPSAQQKINDKVYRSERLSAWIKAINRIDITPLNAQYKLICSEHFETGAPADAYDKSNPDWIPNRNLPLTLTKAIKKTSTTTIINKLDPWDAFDPLAEEEMQIEPGPSEIKIMQNIEIMENEIQQLKLENEMLKKQITSKDSIIAEQNTDLLTLIETHKFELQEKKTIIQMLETTNLKISLSRDGFKNDDKKVNYFTGLPSFSALEIIFNFVQEKLVGCLLRRINKFDALILVLMKLRLDLPLAYIGYRYGIAGNTAATIFHTNLKMLSEEIGPFIRWPEKAAFRENTAVFFKRVLGNKFTALIDFIEDPGPNVSQDYIIQRKYIKHKYLVAISPVGAITFVSKGYDSSLSLKEIAESCGVLDYTDDGDIILSDHGTVTHQVFSYNGCKVLIESRNQEENDLIDSLLQNNSPLTTNDTTKADSSRVYIQRTISNLMNKFCVLTNKQTVGISKSYKNIEGERYFDYVVKVCCALTNVSPVIFNFETKKS